VYAGEKRMGALFLFSSSANVLQVRLACRTLAFPLIFNIYFPDTDHYYSLSKTLLYYDMNNAYKMITSRCYKYCVFILIISYSWFSSSSDYNLCYSLKSIWNYIIIYQSLLYIFRKIILCIYIKKILL